MFLGVIFLKEPVNVMSLIGSGMVLLGLFLIARTNNALLQSSRALPDQEKSEKQ